MEKLELKEIVGYLPYDVGIVPIYRSIPGGFGFNMTILNIEVLHRKNLEDIKPILRPLSDLTKEIEIDGEKFVPIERLYFDFDRYCENGYDFGYIEKDFLEDMPYSEFKKLYSWHFDIHNLINRGLAIDINTLK